MNDMNPMEMMKVARQGKSGVKSLLKDSGKAEVIADALNIMMMDNAMLAKAVGTELDTPTKQFSEDEAADLIAGMVQAEDAKLVQVFADLEAQRMEILKELTSEEQAKSFEDTKKKSLYTHDNSPETGE